MNPSTHSLVNGFSVATAAMFGLLAGSLLGGFFNQNMGGQWPWLGAVGAGLGIASGYWTAGFIVRRFVPVLCPKCNNRMKCRSLTFSEGTTVSRYSCGSCDESTYPALDRVAQSLRSLVPKASDDNETNDSDRRQ